MIQSEKVMSDIHSPINNELQLTQLPNLQISTLITNTGKMKQNQKSQKLLKQRKDSKKQKPYSKKLKQQKSNF